MIYPFRNEKRNLYSGNLGKAIWGGRKCNFNLVKALIPLPVLYILDKEVIESLHEAFMIWFLLMPSTHSHITVRRVSALLACRNMLKPDPVATYVVH